MPIKETIRNSRLGPTVVTAKRVLERARFRDSTSYWERRYASGGTSGAGSYGEVARFKADFLNRFVAEHGVGSVVELGCGDGAQLTLSEYPSYVGLDVSRKAVEMCHARFATDPTKSFIYYEPAHFHNHGAISADLGLSLDVIQHLLDDEILGLHLRHLFGAARHHVVVFTDDRDDSPAAHVRFRRVESWLPLVSGWRLSERVESPVKGADSGADFFVFAPERG